MAEEDTEVAPAAPALYHEKQQLYRCGIHALNNVLQAHMFDKEALDAACAKLAALADPETGGSVFSWAWNPHRSPLGLGNYDVNALMYTLQQQGYDMQWTDKRKPLDKASLDFDALEGVLCNVVMDTFLRSLWGQRHWFAIRKIQGVCYNLDSKLPAPVPFESEDECRRFLQELAATGECELFTIGKTAGTKKPEATPTASASTD